MAYEKIIIENHPPHVSSITLNRPQHFNTFDTLMGSEFYVALKELDADPDIRVIIIKGAGKSFCAGIDVNELENKSAMEYRGWIEHMERPLIHISKMDTPVIAQVHGVAAANGMGVVAAADLAIAADNVRMGLTAVNVGLNCVGPVIPVARSIGRKKALELLLFGDLIGAPEAMSMGLINRVVPKEDLEEETLKWASALANKSPIAVRLAKQGFYRSEDMNYDRQFDYMNEVFARLCSTDDAKEGVKAFFEKRPANWTGK
ncbi:MAG: enoyl-CoA hydratase/isomerase family protein [Desulfobacteraceae bacterium]|nr:MAG: enoyl-CoA hydratase/isomerase family protein [Desulfobacteraceae bacterium]